MPDLLLAPALCLTQHLRHGVRVSRQRGGAEAQPFTLYHGVSSNSNPCAEGGITSACSYAFVRAQAASLAWMQVLRVDLMLAGRSALLCLSSRAD